MCKISVFSIFFTLICIFSPLFSPFSLLSFFFNSLYFFPKLEKYINIGGYPYLQSPLLPGLSFKYYYNSLNLAFCTCAF